MEIMLNLFCVNSWMNECAAPVVQQMTGGPMWLENDKDTVICSYDEVYLSRKILLIIAARRIYSFKEYITKHVLIHGTNFFWHWAKQAIHIEPLTKGQHNKHQFKSLIDYSLKQMADVKLYILCTHTHKPFLPPGPCLCPGQFIMRVATV